MRTNTFQLTRSFLLLIVLVLVLFGIGTLLRLNANPVRAGLYSIFAMIMFGDAATMAFCAWQLRKKTKFAFHVSAIVLGLNAILPFFDQVGWIDLFYILLNLVTLILLITSRKEFIPA